MNSLLCSAVCVLVVAALVAQPTCATEPARSSLAPSDLQCEFSREPLAVDSPAPRFSWRLAWRDKAEAGASQSGYRLLVAAARKDFARQPPVVLWDSGRVHSDATHLVPYEGPPLQSGRQYYWKVRTWDQRGAPSDWSEPARFRLGLLDATDWRAPGIGAANDDATASANQLYRHSFTLDEIPADGVIWVASLGYHVLHVNGRRIGEPQLAPCISDPLHRIRYATYEITPQLQRGRNVIALELGAGWSLYDGQNWAPEVVASRPRRPALRVQVRTIGRDGETREFGSNEQWRTHAADIQPLGRWRFGDFNGERLISRAVPADWTRRDFDDSAWVAAELRSIPDAVRLSPQTVEPNRIVDVVQATEIVEREPGVFRIELDKMFNGFLDLRAEGEPGALVTAEVSDRADQTCVYNQRHEFTLDSTGRGEFCNRFNYTTGQWITLQGPIRPPAASDVAGRLVTTDLRRIGRFRCSDEFHNRLYETSLHTFRCLSLGGYLVDCSHRERLGYGGDGQQGAMLMWPNYHGANFMAKWLEDWSDVQQPDGNLPFTAPTYGGGGGPMWSGIIVHGTCDLYERYGDLRTAEKIYPAIRRWLEFLRQHVRDEQLCRYAGPEQYISSEWSFLGDWVAPGRQQTPNGDAPETAFLNNCYYAWTLRRAATLAGAIGRSDDQQKYLTDADNCAQATHEKYWDEEHGAYSLENQAILAAALLADLAPRGLTPKVEQRLEQQIVERHDGHLDTGILGTMLLLRALQRIDRPDLAFLVVNQRDQPGWAPMLAIPGAALWEQWDGLNSRCHGSFLGVGGWYVESILGIQHDPRAPAYKHFFIRPGVVAGLQWARGSFESPRGRIAVQWEKTETGLLIDVAIPPNSTATLQIPRRLGSNLSINGESPNASLDVVAVRSNSTNTLLDLASGKHGVQISAE